MQKKANSFITSHNLVNRIYDMIYFFGVVKDIANEQVIKNFFKENLHKVEYVESLAKYFEQKLKKHRKNADIRCNLMDLIYDLNYLKQYL